MRAVVQRVTEGSVTIAGTETRTIKGGVVILLGIARTDTTAAPSWLAEKIARLRIFPDDAGNLNRSLLDVGGQALIVSQFTLHARTRKGTRPSFNDAAPAEQAIPLYEQFVRACESLLGPENVQTGEFGAMMSVSLVNDGPVTLIVDSPEASAP